MVLLLLLLVISITVINAITIIAMRGWGVETSER